MKTLLALVLVPLLFTALSADTSEKENAPTLVVELDGFGFRGDLTWIQFEKGMKRAFEEKGVPYELDFKRFPVRDYKGNPALEIRLNQWRKHVGGIRQINFWLTHVSSNGEKTELDIVHYQDVPFDVSTLQLERNLENEAYEASKLMLERIEERISLAAL